MLGRSTSNGKAISKLLKGFATQQVRNKTINLNYRGKSSLRDGLSGSTIEVGTPVNDSMSVSVWSKGYTRCLQINRPRESNRITSEVARDLLHQFKVMDTNPIINLITLSGIGNGFLSAGYDFRELQTLMDKGDLETVYSLVRDTHKLAYYAANCETPTMSVINGLMLGPGTSLGTSANYVIATPGSLFSAADAAYGYFPDCGVTMLLSRVNQKYEGLGTFLGLTGAQLKSSDLVNCGIATSFGMESVSQYIAERLLEVQTGANQDDIHNCIVESTESDVPTLSFAFELYKIKEHFSNKKSVEEIIQSLKNTITDSAKTKPERDWAANILENMNQMSALSLKVIFRGIKECDQGLGLDETYQRDYRIASRLIKSKDFKQGVNSVLTGIEPVWEFESVEQVPDSVVDSLFAPLSFEKDVDCELQLPEEVFLEDQILFQIKKKQSVQVAKQ